MFKYRVIIKDVDHALLKYVKDIAKEYDCEVEELWQDKHNECRVYDYEPFLSSEFDLRIKLISESFDNAKFVEYLYLKRKRLIDSLNKNLEAAKESK